MFVFAFAFIFVLKLPQPRKDLQTTKSDEHKDPLTRPFQHIDLVGWTGTFLYVLVEPASWVDMYLGQVYLGLRVGVFSGSCSSTSEGSLMIWAQDIFLLFSHKEKGFIFCSLFQISCVVFPCVLMCPDMCSPLSGLRLFFFFFPVGEKGQKNQGSFEPFLQHLLLPSSRAPHERLSLVSCLVPNVSSTW